MVLLVVAQIAVAPAVDSIYSTPAVRQLVERASISNRRVPDSLRGYGARVESEMAFVARQADGTEQTFTVEQTASTVHWDRTGQFEQRVIGYRSQSVGVTMSGLGLFRQPWTVPILYGNRLTLLFGRPDSLGRDRSRRRRSDATIAMHPFGNDREQIYRFSGGDTIVTLKPGGRDIPVVRVHVEPDGAHLTRRVIAFQGDIELDEHRAQIIRMRGSFVTIGPRPKARSRFIASQVEAVAYVELENAEFAQQYWLPTFQRIEAQATVSLLGSQRAVFRVMSRFRNLVINPTDSVTVSGIAPLGDTTGRDSAVAATGQPLRDPGGDSLQLTRHRLTFAPRDSIDHFIDWSRGIGELTSTAHADDFIDIAPDSWRPSGRPIVRLRFQQPSDLFHFNRIEGAYTGVAGEAAFRDATPGVVARANVGWSWAERTSRGRASIERQQGRLWPSVRAGRSLDITNDFREPFDSGSTLGALFSVDDYDYVDRRTALAGLTWFPSRRRDVRVRVEGGIASDHYVRAQRARGLFARGDSGFRFNRGVDEGSYRIAMFKLEVHPDINAAFVRPGVGALIQAEAASGDIGWQRAEIRLVARRNLGPMVIAARADMGIVAGDSLPPQQLFELGENQNLPGYGYKEFAGNQAAVVRGLIMYPLPLWRSPLRIGRYILPSIAPMVSFGAQSGSASATSSAARSSIRRLGSVSDSVFSVPAGTDSSPVSRPTDGLKSSIDFRLRFLGGAVSLGIARATDRHQAWRFVVGLAQVL